MKHTRRDFLRTSKQTALATAAGVAVANEARGAKKDSANDPVPLGVIGVGGRASHLMGFVTGGEAGRIVGVCDIDRSRLRAAADRIGKAQGKPPQTFTDFRELLADDAIEAVFVTTPHHWHCPIALAALAAGKHVYVEKPAAHVFREGRLLAEAAKRHKRVVQHGTQMRSSAVTAAAGEVLDSGVLGEIKMAKAWGVEPRSPLDPVADGPVPEGLDWDTWLGPAPKRPYNRLRHRSWNNFRDYGNGEIGGDGIHDIDMAMWGLGVESHPVRITAHGSRIHVKGAREFPDNMTVTYQYADDKVLIYENRNFAPYKMHGWDNGNVFYGTKGYMVFSRRGYFQTYLGKEEKEGPGMRGGDGVPEHIANFIAAVRGEAKVSTGAEVAHLGCGLVHLGEIAHRLERVLHFDPENERFVGDPQADAMLSKKYREPWGLGG